jgi:hypothetical protein
MWLGYMGETFPNSQRKNEDTEYYLYWHNGERMFAVYRTYLYEIIHTYDEEFYRESIARGIWKEIMPPEWASSSLINNFDKAM